MFGIDWQEVHRQIQSHPRPIGDWLISLSTLTIFSFSCKIPSRTSSSRAIRERIKTRISPSLYNRENFFHCNNIYIKHISNRYISSTQNLYNNETKINCSSETKRVFLLWYFMFYISVTDIHMLLFTYVILRKKFVTISLLFFFFEH